MIASAALLDDPVDVEAEDTRPRFSGPPRGLNRCSRRANRRRRKGETTTTRGTRGKSGLFLNNRHYDPTTGVFISVDSLVTETMQPYIYGAANPIAYSDPDGLEPCPQSGCKWQDSGGRLPIPREAIVGEEHRGDFSQCMGGGSTASYCDTGSWEYQQQMNELERMRQRGACPSCSRHDWGPAIFVASFVPAGRAVRIGVGAGRAVNRAYQWWQGRSSTPAEAQPSGKPNFKDPTKSPGRKWEWRGKDKPGGDKGAWYRPDTKETLHPDLKHPDPIGPHYDWRAPDGTFWRVYPDGRVIPK